MVKVDHKLDCNDSDFVEAYVNVTKLLQTFINRQQSLKKSDTERCENTNIIHHIQWIRYHFWGNSDSTIVQKTNLGGWSFRKLIFITSMNHLNEFTREQLNTTKEYVTSPELIELILDKILPQQSNSIFATNLVERSLPLQHEVERMRKKIHPDD